MMDGFRTAFVYVRDSFAGTLRETDDPADESAEELLKRVL